MGAKWLYHPCRLEGPQFRDEFRMQPTCGQSGYITFVVSRVPNAWRGEEIGNGYLTPAVSGSLMGAKWLHNPFLLGGPQSGEEFGTRPTSGQRGYITPAVSGIPNTLCGEEIRTWPACGQSVYITHAVSRVPKSWRNSECGRHVGKVATSPMLSPGSPKPRAGRKLEMVF